jgi:hypothetical protein
VKWSFSDKYNKMIPVQVEREEGEKEYKNIPKEVSVKP